MNLNDLHHQLILGVDTHLDVHVAVLLNRVGEVVSSEDFATTTKGYRELLCWCKSYGQLLKAGVEGTGTYGAGLAKFLHDNDVLVFEVNRPNRLRRRLLGKTDKTDAENAARAVLANEARAIPKQQTGPVEALRYLSVARKSAVKARTQTMNQIRALLVTAPDELREKYYLHRPLACAKACAAIEPRSDSALIENLEFALSLLAKRWLALSEELKQLDKRLSHMVKTTASRLLVQYGVGVYVATTLLITAGDNPERLRKESSFAALCGVSPIEASSGKTQRHRLNRGGCRAANNALWTVTQIRMRSDPRTKDYVARRTAEGLSPKEITRSLKRYIARELFPIILEDLSQNKLT